MKNKVKNGLLGLLICLLLAGCAKSAPAAPAPAGETNRLTPESAKAYLAAADELIAHLGYTEAEAAESEYVHGGFLRDWDGDGTDELCLLLKTSPRENDAWDGTPLYGWNPPTLYLYTVRNGEAVRAGACDLYFATAGREAAVASLPGDNGVLLVRWDRSVPEDATFVSCFTLENGALQKTDAPAAVSAAAEGAETARDFLAALGGGAQLLLYNLSGEASIESEANARELRAALAAAAE